MHVFFSQTHSQRPADVPAVASQQEHAPPSHQRRRSRGVSFGAAAQTCTGGERDAQISQPKQIKRKLKGLLIVAARKPGYLFLFCEQRYKGPSSRAHSAINDEGGVTVSRDRHHLLDIFSRPNTTHTYRVRSPVQHTHDILCHRWLTCLFVRLFSQSDTPYRRSFTVLDNIGQGRTGRASVATGQKFNLFNFFFLKKKREG